MNVHHRNLDRQRAFVAADQCAAGGQRTAFADDARLRGGAAHVKRDRVGQAKLRADRLRADDAGSGAGFEHAHAVAPRVLRRKQAAGRLHHVEVAAKALVGQVLLELADVGGDARADVGVGHRCGDAFKLAVLLRQLVRGTDECVRHLLLQDLLDALLVRGIAVGVQQQHGHRLDVLAGQLTRQRAHRRLVERLVRAAVGAQPLGHFKTQRALDQGRVLVEEQVVGIGAIDAADLVDVAKAFGNQERGPGASALQQRVDGNRRAMQEELAFAQIDVRAVERALDPVDQFAMRRQRLAEQQLAAGLVERGHVGERAANVDGDAQGADGF